MPKKKAPGPDGITAELITEGGQPAKEMTDRLIKNMWETAEIPRRLN